MAGGGVAKLNEAMLRQSSCLKMTIISNNGLQPVLSQKKKISCTRSHIEYISRGHSMEKIRSAHTHRQRNWGQQLEHSAYTSLHLYRVDRIFVWPLAVNTAIYAPKMRKVSLHATIDLQCLWHCASPRVSNYRAKKKIRRRRTSAAKKNDQTTLLIFHLSVRFFVLLLCSVVLFFIYDDDDDDDDDDVALQIAGWMNKSVRTPSMPSRKINTSSRFQVTTKLIRVYVQDLFHRAGRTEERHRFRKNVGMKKSEKKNMKLPFSHPPINVAPSDWCRVRLARGKAASFPGRQKNQRHTIRQNNTKTRKNWFFFLSSFTILKRHICRSKSRQSVSGHEIAYTAFQAHMRVYVYVCVAQCWCDRSKVERRSRFLLGLN
jgi:hypothetical protein